MNILNLTGQKFGKLVALKCIGHHKTKSQFMWRCKCECGNLVDVCTNNLTSGNTKSCGCLAKHNLEIGRKIKDLSGKTFSDLLVIEKVGIDLKHRTSLWKVRCLCGNEKVVRIDGLTSGRVKSCGCRKSKFLSDQFGDKHWNWRGGCYGGYTEKWTDELKELVRNRDNRKCQFPGCNYSDISSNIKLDIHHIDGIKEHSYSRNLISLCHRHHMKIESNHPRNWEDYFYSITGDYEYA